MEIIEAIILGLVQGLTEFLPVSSSGHLVMVQTLLGVEPESGIVFEVALHLATLVAIVVFYHKRVWALTIGTLTFDPETWRYVGKLAIGTLPAILVALTVRDLIEAWFESPMIVGVMLLITGGIVWSTRYTIGRGQLREPSWRDAFLIGCAQAFAIMPGITRSGTTVATAMALGMSPLAAAEFSFMLGIIAMAGAAVLLAPDIANASTGVLTAILAGGGVALVSGLFALFSFVWLLRSRLFYVFAWYAWLVGGSFLLWLLLA
ncbi:MAG: undecaprenyl-diphosphate phosphatase [Pseudomonadales bacterium]